MLMKPREVVWHQSGDWGSWVQIPPLRPTFSVAGPSCPPRPDRTDAGASCPIQPRTRDGHSGASARCRLDSLPATLWRSAGRSGPYHFEVACGNALWSLPAARTKNGLPHDVPLSTQAVALFEALPLRRDRALLFGQGVGPFSGLVSIEKAAGSENRSPARRGTPWATAEAR